MPTNDESVSYRQHWIVFAEKSLIFLGLAALPLIFLIKDAALFFPFELDPTLIVLFGSLYYLYLALFQLYAFFDHYLDLWTITSSELIHSEQRSLFQRTHAKQELVRIQDVEVQIRGILPTLFNYGNISIQTAGTQERVTFEKVGRPHAIADTIMQRVHALQEERPAMTR